MKPKLPLQVCKSILLFLTGQVGVDIHRRGDIGVSHYLLYNLQSVRVRSVFTHPCAECMPQMVSGEVRQQYRAAAFLPCALFLFKVVIADDAVNTVIDAFGVMNTAVRSDKE